MVQLQTRSVFTLARVFMQASRLYVVLREPGYSSGSPFIRNWNCSVSVSVHEESPKAW